MPIVQTVTPITPLSGFLSPDRPAEVDNLVEVEIPQLTEELIALIPEMNSTAGAAALSESNASDSEGAAGAYASSANDSKLAAALSESNASDSEEAAGLSATAANNSKIAAGLSEEAAALSAASVDANNILHTIGSGLPNEAYDKIQADALLDTKTNTSINLSTTLAGNFAIVSTDLVATNVVYSVSNGINNNGSNNSIFNLSGNIIPTNGFADGDNYIKLFADGSSVSTLEAPSYGIVSITGDYLLNGLWYDKTDVLYAPQFAYASEEGKLLKITASSGVPTTIILTEDAPSIAEDCIQANIMISEEYKGKNACTAFATFNGQNTPPTNNGNFNIGIISRVATGTFEMLFDSLMDTVNYAVAIGYTGTGGNNLEPSYSKSLDKVTILFYLSNGALANPSEASIHILGGKN